jgi:hypothetical protein
VPTLKDKLERIVEGYSSNHALVQSYLVDKYAQQIATVLQRLTEQQGRPAKHPPSAFLPMLD